MADPTRLRPLPLVARRPGGSRFVLHHRFFGRCWREGRPVRTAPRHPRTHHERRSMARTHPRAHPQHRHHGAHRCRQDHHDRAHPTTPAATTRSVRSTRVRPRWTGWSRSRSGASPSRRRPPRAWNDHCINIIDTLATSTSPSRSSAAARLDGAVACSTVWPASNPRPRTCGVRPTSTAPRMCLSPRWTAWAPTSSAALDRIRDRLDRTAVIQRRSAPKATTRASSTS
jgi:hypothetical protein